MFVLLKVVPINQLLLPAFTRAYSGEIDKIYGERGWYDMQQNAS